MNLEVFRRDCENRNNSDECIKGIIMQALRDGKNTEDKRTELLEILKKLRPNVHAVVEKNLQRHSKCIF